MKNTFVYIAFALTLILGVVAGSWLRELRPGPPPETIIQTDTVWRHDTLQLPAPKPKVAHVIDSVFVEVRDTVHHRDTTFIVLPISQTFYKEEDYEAWVSGYNARIDSLHIFRSTAIVEVPVEKIVRKRWGVGVQAGVTYLPKTGVSPYIGIGISYNLLTF